jgi:hypothetical protein
MIALSNVWRRSFGTFQGHFAGLRLQITLVVASAGVTPSLGPVVTLRVAKPISLAFQSYVTNS